MTDSQAFMNVSERDVGVNVVFLSLGEIDSRRYVENLQVFGFSVSLRRSLSDVCASAPNESPALFVVQAPSAVIHVAVTQLRQAFRHAGIVGVIEFSDRLSRVALLMSGADSCVDCDPESWELLATLLACQRRVRSMRLPMPISREQHQAALYGEPKVQEGIVMPESERPWRLDDDGWSIVAPNGVKLQMNRPESDVMKFFFNHPREPVLRSDLNAFVGADSPALARDIDVVISRLRRKAAQLSLRLPIYSVRGTGYVFAVDEVL